MLAWTSAIVVGISLLIWGSDRLVLGASAAARNLGVPPLLIGLTIVGVGTSAPEVLVSAMASLNGNPTMAIGNAVGSNIANVGLVAGITALIVPITVHSRILKREFPLMFAVIAVAWLVLYDQALGRFDALVLLFGFVALLAVMSYTAFRYRRPDPLIGEFEQYIPKSMSTGAALWSLVIGLALLLLASRLIVWGAAGVARALGVSDLIIGLTIVAVGTSLPELAAAVASMVKREPDLAVGNILGSNMFNMLLVLAAPGLIAPSVFGAEVLGRDMLFMTLMSAALFVMAFGFVGPGRINRLEGATLALAFAGYQGLIFYATGL